MPDSDLSSLLTTAQQDVILKRVSKKFAESKYGDSLRAQVRWNRYRPKHVSVEQWAEILEDETYTLSHMQDCLKGAKRFLKHLKSEQNLEKQDEAFILLAAAIHDWGKCASSTNSSKDISWDQKTVEDMNRERETFKELFDSFIGKDEIKLKYIIEQTIFNASSRLGEIFSSIERLVPHLPYPDGSDHPVSAPDTSAIPQSSYGYFSGMSKVSATNPGQSSGRQFTGDEALEPIPK